MRVLSVIYIMAMLAMLPATLCAQVKRYSRAEIDSLLNPKLFKGANELLLFDKVKENLGTMYESDKVRKVQFTFCNVSDSEVTITKVTTHCGCTASSFDAKPIKPGARGEVVITYNPKGRSGTIDTDAFVYTNLSGTQPVARLTLLGNVINSDEWSHLPHSMGALKVKRKSISFATLQPGTTRAVRIPCANVGKSPLELSSLLLPQYATFATEPATLQPGEEGDIVITVAADKLPKSFPDTLRFSVVIDGVAGRLSDRTIKAEITK